MLPGRGDPPTSTHPATPDRCDWLSSVPSALSAPEVGSLTSQGRSRPKVIEGSQHVVVPAVRMQEVQVFPIDGLAVAEPAEEVALQQIFLAGAARRALSDDGSYPNSRSCESAWLVDVHG